ncbi:MAG: hypothetical protein LPK45_00625 [Bacteroidota bacterium]|nr:hypothetical protein [Bacteroidota bacterium]MDX5429529.1 hypothetical protein [Bacteroidota bacterium]MDX5468316.1 hypothetical protein [Bacteroidota bacterium]
MKNILKWSLALSIGGLLGFSYWYFFGCQGNCGITSSPVNSSLYGMGMAALLKGDGFGR